MDNRAAASLQQAFISAGFSGPSPVIYCKAANLSRKARIPDLIIGPELQFCLALDVGDPNSWLRNFNLT